MENNTYQRAKKVAVIRGKMKPLKMTSIRATTDRKSCG